MKKIPSLSAGFLVISLALVSFAGAQTVTKGALRELHSGIRSTLEETHDQVTNERVDARFRTSGLTPEQIQTRRQQMYQDIEKMHDTMHENMQKLRDEMKTKMEGYRKDLHDKLASMRDERKKNLVEHLDTRFGEIHDKFVEHFTKVLDRLDEILGRIQSRADKAAAAGKDVSPATKAIAAAKPLIDAARAKVQDFAGKTYPLNITTEDKLGPAVSASRKALHDDLEKVRDTIAAARKAVGEAAAALGSVPKVDEDHENEAATSTSSTTQNP